MITGGQKAAAAKVKTAPKKQTGIPAWMNRPAKAGVPNWANRAAKDTGPALNFESNGFAPLKAKRKGDWKIPAGLVAGAGTASAAGGVYAHKKVKKAFAAPKPMAKPPGVLKPTTPTKVATPPKPATPVGGAKPAAAPKAPAPVTTLRSPSMMPPKPTPPKRV